jgi:hypothetical protein
MLWRRGADHGLGQQQALQKGLGSEPSAAQRRAFKGRQSGHQLLRGCCGVSARGDTRERGAEARLTWTGSWNQACACLRLPAVERTPAAQSGVREGRAVEGAALGGARLLMLAR